MSDNINDCSKEEQDGDIVSMVDVLADEEALQENADAVLGATDDKNCTYAQGYVDRQPLYSCRTCAESAKHNLGVDLCAGVCLACSLKCHEGHELVELYTKRNFRCDCGNSKFPGNPCKLFPNKSEENDLNKYNQNYSGLYCTCHRPYPDPEDEIDDVMIQCIICEDWFHQRHVAGDWSVDVDSYDEMICPSCVSANPFIWAYAASNSAGYNPANKLTMYTKTCEEDDVKIDGDHDVRCDNVNKDDATIKNADEAENDKTDKSSQDTSSNNDTAAGGEDKEDAVSQIVCHLTELNWSEERMKECQTYSGPVFLTSDWRNDICSCDTCKSMYEKSGVSYLLNPSDSVSIYEAKGKSMKKESNYEQGMKALATLDRAQQIELLHGYADMKGELLEYLKKFTENKKVVREEDIAEFFTEFTARKRQRTDSGGISQNFLQ